VTTANEPKSTAQRAREALKDGLLILFRMKNNKLDYSIMNRPEPALSGMDDHALATAIVHAGRQFTIVRTVSATKRERISRDDGRVVTYKDSIDIDWDTGAIKSTRGRELTLLVLSIIVENLIAAAQRSATAQRNRHGVN